MSEEFLERKIVIGLITSTEYIKAIRDIFKHNLLDSQIAKRLARWTIDYYDKYKKAPGKEIEDIYFEKLRKGLPKDIAEEIEQDILPSLSKEYEKQTFTIDYLITQTEDYFALKEIELLQDKVDDLLDTNEIQEVQSLLKSYRPLSRKREFTLSMNNTNALQKVIEAFEESKDSLIYFPKALGQFWNDQFVRGGFVGLMAPEKRGKTFWLMEFAYRAARQGRKVAFFQAGDMNENQQIRRFVIHVAKNSDKEKYCGKMLEPVPDCIHNQLDTCSRAERECDFGIFDHYNEKDLRYDITFDELKEALKEYPDYSPCTNCELFKNTRVGTPWLKEVEIKEPLTIEKATQVYQKYFIDKNRQILLDTYANGTLTLDIIENQLAKWEEDGFAADIVIVDYAELLEVGYKTDERSKQNIIWKSLRRISGQPLGGKLPLVITVTQTDAKAYEKGLLSLDNFSEDKRKYAHCTAMYGLNQDPKGREKEIGVMRINEMLLREGDFNPKNVVYVLQNLKRGQPFISSFF